MNEYISYGLQIILIIIAIAIVFHKRNFTIIILIATFGLIAAILYIMNKAPDVAIAEVAIGSAIIPLIYVISISRQREFIVLDRAQDGFITYGETFSGEGYEILDQFVKSYDLSLNICVDIRGNEKELSDQLNVDLIITKDINTNKYVLKGKASSVLMAKLKQMVKDKTNIEVETFKGGDSND
jgi:putative multicomponent Na+:H+ antiporter subunit B